MILNYLMAILILTFTASADFGDENIRLTCRRFGEVFVKGKHSFPHYSYSLCKTKDNNTRLQSSIFLEQRLLLKGKISEANVIITDSGSIVVIGKPKFDVQNSANECTSSNITLEINIWKRTLKDRNISVTPWSGNEEKSVRLVATVVPGMEHESTIHYFDMPLGSVIKTCFLSQKTIKHSHVYFVLRHLRREDKTPVDSIERTLSFVKNYAKIVFHAASVETDDFSEYLYQKNSEIPSGVRSYWLGDAGLEVGVNAFCVADKKQHDENEEVSGYV